MTPGKLDAKILQYIQQEPMTFESIEWEFDGTVCSDLIKDSIARLLRKGKITHCMTTDLLMPN